MSNGNYTVVVDGQKFSVQVAEGDADIQVIKPVLSNENIISITTTIKDRWNVHSYFMRFMGISLDDRKLHNFFLTLKNELPDDTVNYRKITVNTSVFDLYYCQK